MEPVIKNNDLVFVSSIFYLFKDPKLNDIVAFKHNNKILVKRIIKISKNMYFPKGDNSSDSFDARSFGYIKRKDILGKVFKII